MNGNVSQSDIPSETKTERTRLQDRPTISVSKLAALQRGYVERLGKLIEQLTAVLNRPNPPTAAIGSPESARDAHRGDVRGNAHDDQLGKLTRTIWPDGSTSYGLRTHVLRSTVAKVLGAPRPAFVERGGATSSRYLELVGTTDRDISASMAYAAHRWGNDEIIIHAGGRHTAKIIEHALAHGLNVANRDSYVQSLVAAERTRQATSRRGRIVSVADTIAVIERAPSAPYRLR